MSQGKRQSWNGVTWTPFFPSTASWSSGFSAELDGKVPMAFPKQKHVGSSYLFLEILGCFLKKAGHYHLPDKAV